MPRKNVIKTYTPNSFYHIYSRGVNKQKTFVDDKDYGYFLALFKRYLSIETEISQSRNGMYPNYREDISLNTFCLMQNHIHMLVYQHDNSKVITELMRSIITSYTMYFNKKHKRVGSLFESPYKASLIDKDSYLHHISTRYIHLNPGKDWKSYEFSSIQYYSGIKSATWLEVDDIMSLFDNKKDYMKFVADYEENKKLQDELKWELANN